MLNRAVIPSFSYYTRGFDESVNNANYLIRLCKDISFNKAHLYVSIIHENSTNVSLHLRNKAE